MVCFSCSHLAHNPSRSLCNQSSLCYVTLVCCWWMIPSMLLDCWGFLARELWVFFYTYIYKYNCVLCFHWDCDGLFERKLAATASLFLSEGGFGGKRGSVELEIYGLEGDWLVPSLALMYGWQSPPPNPSHLLAHTHSHEFNHTVQHTATHTSRHRSVPQAFPDSPPELLHVKL